MLFISSLIVQTGFVYIKIHFKTNQGIKNLSQAEADKLAGQNPSYHTAELHDAIEKGDYPSWTMYFQVMRPEQAENYRWNIFDMTKVWPHADFPLQPVAKLTLNRNVRCPCLLPISWDICIQGLTDTFRSPKTTSRILNRLRSPRQPWFRALLQLQIPVRHSKLPMLHLIHLLMNQSMQCSKPACSPTQTRPATAWA